MTEHPRRTKWSQRHGDYPGPFILLPMLEHKQSFIILHGRGSNGEEFGKAFLQEKIQGDGTFAEAFPHAKFVFPSAAVRRATVYKKSPIHQWFDNWTLDKPTYREELQIEGLKESTQYIHQLLRQEIELVGMSNVVLGGLSQGCATALVSLILWDGDVLPAVFGMCGWLPFRSHLEAVAKSTLGEIDNPIAQVDDIAMGHDPFDRDAEEAAFNVQNPAAEALKFLREMLDLPFDSRPAFGFQQTNVFIGHGQDDAKVPVTLGREAAGCMEIMGLKVVLREYPNLAHWYSTDMLGDVVSFLRQFHTGTVTAADSQSADSR